jgi:hypothetical protein
MIGLGGDKRNRTADIYRAKVALYQLSYTPNFKLVFENI